MTCISRPRPESDNSSWTSSRRQRSPLMAYSLCPDRNISRLIVTSAYSMGSAPSLLSMVSVTSARPSGAREVVPAKTTSSILPPRSDLAPCSPMTQHSASTMFDLPEPFGPTTQVIPVSRRSEVADAKDLKPRSVRLLRYIGQPSLRLARPYRAPPSSLASHRRSGAASPQTGPGAPGRWEGKHSPGARSDSRTARAFAKRRHGRSPKRAPLEEPVSVAWEPGTDDLHVAFRKRVPDSQAAPPNRAAACLPACLP